MQQVFEVLASVVLFLNKTEMRKKEPQAWLLGMDGAILLGIVFFQKALWVSLGYLAGFFLLLVYGYILATTKWGRREGFWQFFVRVIIIFVTFVVCIFLFVATYHIKNFTFWQLISSLSGLSGTLYLAFKKAEHKVAGWKFYICSHITTAYIALGKGLWFIAVFQIISIWVAVTTIKELQR